MSQMVRIRWTFDDSVAASPFMERWLADVWIGEVSQGQRVDPLSGEPDHSGISPRRAKVVTE